MLGLFLKVRWFLFKEAREVKGRFPAFAPYEKALRRAYRFRNPYRMSNGIYGETPLPVFAQIAQELNENDTVIELGCGRGRGVFFLSQLVGCKVLGVDCVPFFIQTAQAVQTALPVQFQCAAMENVVFSRATAVYLYGTCLTDEEMDVLATRFETMQPGAKVITVSFPLSDYSTKFRTHKQFTATFPWGEGEIYISLKEAPSSLPAEGQR